MLLREHRSDVRPNNKPYSSIWLMCTACCWRVWFNVDHNAKFRFIYNCSKFPLSSALDVVAKTLLMTKRLQKKLSYLLSDIQFDQYITLQSSNADLCRCIFYGDRGCCLLVMSNSQQVKPIGLTWSRLNKYYVWVETHRSCVFHCSIIVLNKSFFCMRLRSVSVE